MACSSDRDGINPPVTGAVALPAALLLG